MEREVGDRKFYLDRNSERYREGGTETYNLTGKGEGGRKEGREGGRKTEIEGQRLVEKGGRKKKKKYEGKEIDYQTGEGGIREIRGEGGKEGQKLTNRHER